MLKFKIDEPLSRHTSFKIGGPASWFCSPKNSNELKEALQFAKKHKLKIFIIGAGSNVLFSDEGFNGLVIKLAFGAGQSLSYLVNSLSKQGYDGLEYLAGIPGSVGGAVYMNAGQAGVTIGDLVEKVWTMDFNGKEKVFSKAQCKFGYRKSVFQKLRLIITKVELKLKKGDSKAIREKISQMIKDKTSKQPYDHPSAGSIFKNPKGHSAWKLIEDAGLKGKRIGGAMVSEKHANFIVNLGHAKAADVLKLIDIIQTSVKKKFKIKLVTEIKIIE